MEQPATRSLPVVVEGSVDEAVLLRLAEVVGGTIGPVYGRRGKQYIRGRIAGFNQAAWQEPWLVLVDLDNYDCAPLLLGDWLPSPASHMLLRVAVREVESWLLADRQAMAGFLAVSTALMPRAPEALADPKLELVNLAKRSRRRAIRQDIVPRPGSERQGWAHSSAPLPMPPG